LQDIGPTLTKLALYLLIERHLSAAEPIDRLLGISDEEELPRNRSHLPPVIPFWLLSGEKQDELRLERIRILKLVHEEVREAVLEFPPYACVLVYEVARHH